MTATISLEELIASSALLSRLDRKYLVNARDLPALSEAVLPSARVLEIDGLTWFGYRSVYYDTDALRCYTDAGRGRRRRFKVRTRQYEHTGDSWLEVKTRGPRGSTIKDRLPRAGASADLAPTESDWLAHTLQARRIPAPPVRSEWGAGELRPTLTTSYLRRTLQVSPGADQPPSRVTFDVGLDCELPDDAPGGAVSAGFERFVIVETKGTTHPSSVDRLLWSMGHRPISISKYGVGIATLRTDQPPLKWHHLLAHQLAG